MCGICGIVKLAEGEIPSLTLLKGMTETLSHRGPDAWGYYRDKQVAFGHTRLSIIDLYSGAQPQSNEDESIWITFNGEIFNYLELRHELISKGHIFKTESDTETIIHSWEEWGDRCFRKFNGQWAIALWDAKRKELVLSRDRHGIRPLYYTIHDDTLLFASEIKALFCDDRVKREFSIAGLGEIFTFWSSVAPVTAYEDIHELPPGSFSVLKKGQLKTESYWSIEFPGKPDRPESLSPEKMDSYAEELREKLIDAARLRFTRSDVPVGAYLSGGIDSSITSAILAKYTDTELNTFSLRFMEGEFDEGGFQRTMAERLGTKHREVLVSNRDIGEIFPEVIHFAERPILRTAPAPLFLLSRLVRSSGYKVVVTGEGADEVLGGYDLFREAKVRRMMASDPDSDQTRASIEALYPWMERTPGKAPAFAKAFFSKDLKIDDPFFSHRPRWNSTSAVMQIFSDHFKEQYQSEVVEKRLRLKLPDSFGKWAPLNRDQWLEYTTLLSGYILSAQGDRMLMGNSVEGRFPFLDPHVVDFANSLPVDAKLNGMNEKYILKKAFSDLVPEEILNRPKQPYRAPDIQSFFFESGKMDWLEELTSRELIRESGIFKPEAITGLINKCRKKAGAKMSNTDNMRVVGVLSTMLCYKNLIKKQGFSAEHLPEPSVSIDIL